MISGVVHELGHVTVGLSSGWKFYTLIVGPFGLKRNANDKITLYLEKNPMMWGDIGGTFPRSADADKMKIWSNVLFGGPIASITMGCIFSLLALLAKTSCCYC
jgi:hypothetical protein